MYIIHNTINGLMFNGFRFSQGRMMTVWTDEQAVILRNYDELSIAVSDIMNLSNNIKLAIKEVELKDFCFKVG